MKLLYRVMSLGCLFLCAWAQDDNAAYLLEDNFWALNPYCSQTKIISGWEVEGGTYGTGQRYGHNYFDFWATNGLTMRKLMAGQDSGTIVLEYRFNVSAKADGITWRLQSGNTDAVKILTSNGNLCYENSGGAVVTLQSYEANREIGVKVVADISSKKTDISVNGVLRASNVDFRNDVGNVDYFNLYVGAAGAVTLHQRFVHVYKAFVVNERFLAGDLGNVADDWSVDSGGGVVRVVKNEEASQPPDFYSVRMDDGSDSSGVSMAKAFTPQTGKVEFEYKFMQPAKQDGFAAELRDGLASAVRIVTDNGNLCYEIFGGIKVSVWDGYLSDVWYFVRVTADFDAHTADIYVNDIKKATGVPIVGMSASGVDGAGFATSVSGTDVVWLDDIQVYPFRPYPSDYVPEPSPVPHSPYRVGVIACNLWREGVSYSGWDWISSCPARSPVLGFYDEGNPEVADWEIKFMVDHGIDFIYPCWYRPQSGAGTGPIKDEVISNHAMTAYKRAKYSGYINYSLIIECGNCPMKSMDDWKYNVVPFIMEHYFKDPKYLVVDNKPVLGFFGGLNGTGDNAAAMEYLRGKCVEAGFAGVTGIGCTWTGDQGFEYTYTYCQRFTPESVPTHIGSPSVNWDRASWEEPYVNSGTWRSAAVYESLLVAQKRLMPAKTGLGQTMMLLGNWNEYGEGHFLVPTVGLGFRYLDAIRRVFGDGSGHQDTIPTFEQKARMNLLYRKGLGGPDIGPSPNSWVRDNDDANTALYSSGVLNTIVSGYYYGDAHFSNVTGEYAEYGFNGTGIRWLGKVGLGHGSADVFLDGVLMERVSTYGASDRLVQVCYEKTGLADSAHTLKIVVADNDYTDWDAFEYYFTGGNTSIRRPSVVSGTGSAEIHCAPNPFNPSTTFLLSISRAQRASLILVDMRGRLICSWPLNGAEATLRMTWDGKDGNGQSVASGVYMARLTVDGKTCTRKLILNR